MTSFDFTGKNVVVVGGSGGIGNSIARMFHEAGASVLITGTRESPEDYGPEADRFEGLTYSRLIISDDASVQQWDPGISSLDTLVLSQGLVQYRRREFEADIFRQVVDVNLNSVMNCAVKFKPLLSASGGTIITVSSVGGIKATIGNPAYAASKAGLIHLTRVLGAAWAADGIRVNGIAPGLIRTKMTTVTTDDPKRLAARLESIPLKRLGTPEEMAAIALFLASPMASYIIGHTIVADGGRTA